MDPSSNGRSHCVLALLVVLAGITLLPATVSAQTRIMLLENQAIIEVEAYGKGLVEKRRTDLSAHVSKKGFTWVARPSKPPGVTHGKGRCGTRLWCVDGDYSSSLSMKYAGDEVALHSPKVA